MPGVIDANFLKTKAENQPRGEDGQFQKGGTPFTFEMFKSGRQPVSTSVSPTAISNAGLTVSTGKIDVALPVADAGMHSVTRKKIMPYTMSKPPEWAKNFSSDAKKFVISIFNAVHKDTGDENQARAAALSQLKKQFEQDEKGEWVRRATEEITKEIRFRAEIGQVIDTLRFEACLIIPGYSKNCPPLLWTDDVLQKAVDDGLFDNIDVNLYERESGTGFGHIQGDYGVEDFKRYLIKELAGKTGKAEYREGDGVYSVIQFRPDYQWLYDLLVRDRTVLGLSIDSRIQGMETENSILVKNILAVSSVDIVTRPAAGGRFIRAVAGLDINNGDKIMREKMLKVIQEKKPDLLSGKTTEMIAQMSEDDILTLYSQATEKPPAKEERAAMDDDRMAGIIARAMQAVNPMRPDEIAGMVKAEAEKLFKPAEMAKAIQDVTTGVQQRAACDTYLRNALADSGLPELTQKKIKPMFEGRIFQNAELDNEIKSQREYLAALKVPEFEIQTTGTGAQVGLDPATRVTMACDRMFGITQADYKMLAGLKTVGHKSVFPEMRAMAAEDFDKVEPLSGMRELYQILTGDMELTGRGDAKNIKRDIRASMDITSQTFTYVLGNTMNRRLVAAYKEPSFGEDILISMRKSVDNFKLQEAINMGYFGDIATVDPETETYQEISAVTDEESTYRVATKGNMLTITRRTIIDDDIGAVQRMISNLGRAARRTHAKYVWDFYLSNANCSDGTAWFTSGHGNLGATALSFATALTGYLALVAMTEKDSGAYIGALDDPAVLPTLVYPTVLMATAEKIIQQEDYYSTNDLTTKTLNPLKGKIKGFRMGLETDTNNWGLIMPASLMNIVEMGYLKGRQEPELWIVDQQTSEAMVISDKHRYRLRHEYGGALIDYRTGYKAIVT